MTEKGQNRAEIVYEDNSSNCPLLVVIHSISVLFCPFLSIRIRGKEEIIPFKDKKEIQSVKAHLCSVFSGFVKIGDWYLKMSEIKEYKPVTAEDMNPYILFKTSKFGNIKVRFPKDEDMNAELLVLDQLFDVE